jgi:hypothetical protein
MEFPREKGLPRKCWEKAPVRTQRFMGGIERGERNLALRNIEKIADTLGIPIAELMEDV